MLSINILCLQEGEKKMKELQDNEEKKSKEQETKNSSENQENDEDEDEDDDDVKENILPEVEVSCNHNLCTHDG